MSKMHADKLAQKMSDLEVDDHQSKEASPAPKPPPATEKPEKEKHRHGDDDQDWPEEEMMAFFHMMNGQPPMMGHPMGPPPPPPPPMMGPHPPMGMDYPPHPFMGMNHPPHPFMGGPQHHPMMGMGHPMMGPSHPMPPMWGRPGRCGMKGRKCGKGQGRRGMWRRMAMMGQMPPFSDDLDLTSSGEDQDDATKDAETLVTDEKERACKRGPCKGNKGKKMGGCKGCCKGGKGRRKMMKIWMKAQRMGMMPPFPGPMMMNSAGESTEESDPENGASQPEAMDADGKATKNTAEQQPKDSSDSDSSDAETSAAQPFGPNPRVFWHMQMIQHHRQAMQKCLQGQQMRIQKQCQAMRQAGYDKAAIQAWRQQMKRQQQQARQQARQHAMQQAKQCQHGAGESGDDESVWRQQMKEERRRWKKQARCNGAGQSGDGAGQSGDECNDPAWRQQMKEERRQWRQQCRQAAREAAAGKSTTEDKEEGQQ